MSAATPSQTVGPFPHEAWDWAVQATSGSGEAPALLQIDGQLLDGQGEPVNDGWVEASLPAEAEEQGAMPGFRRLPTDAQGRFTLALRRPPLPGEPAAYLCVFARGLLQQQWTAVFLADAAGVEAAALLAQVPAGRRASLQAERESPSSPRYRWCIRLQGAPDLETVFFDYS